MRQTSTAELLRSKGIRPTPQRLCIYDYLLHHPTHPTVEEIYAGIAPQQAAFSRTTVYNTLDTLCAAGLVRVLHVGAGETRYDACTADHAHFKCVRCGAVYDLPLGSPALSFALPDGFSVSGVEITLNGRCPTCADSENLKHKTTK